MGADAFDWFKRSEPADAGPKLTEADFRRSCTDKVAVLVRDAFMMAPHNWLHYKIADSHQAELVRLLARTHEILRTAPVVDLRSVECARLDHAVQAVIRRALRKTPIRAKKA